MAINPGDPVGVIESLEGGLVVFRDDGSEAYLQVGDQVSMYDQVFTDPNSSATIRFDDGSSLDIADDSSVFVDEYIYDPSTENIAVADTPVVDTTAPTLDLSLGSAPVEQQTTNVADISGDEIVPDNVAGIIESMTGEAIVIRADGTQESISQGDFVFSNDELFTEGSSALSVRFVDETSFSIGEDSSLVIDEFVYDEQTGEGVVDVSVVKGLFVFISGIVADNNPENMTINTPGTTIGIRGTEGMGKVGENGEESYYVNTDGIITISTETGTVVIDQINETAVVLSPSLPPQMAKEWTSAQVLETFISALRVAPLSVTQRLVDADVSLGSSARSVLNKAIKAVKKAEAEEKAEETGQGNGNGDGTGDGNKETKRSDDDKKEIDDSEAEEIVQAVVFSFADDEQQENEEQKEREKDVKGEDAEELIAEVEQQLVELAEDKAVDEAIEVVVVNTQEEDDEPEEVENLGDPVVTISGVAVDGYLSGAQVFFDANNNGALDVDETVVVTDANGSFTLDVAEGSQGNLVILANGTDILTGESFAFNLRTPITAEDGLNTVVSPLSTLVSALVDGGQTLDQALATVAALAETDSEGLLQRDPVAEATADPASAALLQSALSVQAVVSVLGASLAGASGLSLAEAGDAILAVIAADPSVLADTGSDDFAQILADAASNAGATISEADLAAAGQLTSITLTSIDVGNTNLSSGEQLGRLAQVTELLQASLVGDIQTASASGGLADQFADVLANESIDSLLAIITAEDLGALVPGQTFTLDTANFAPQLVSGDVDITPVAENTSAPEGEVGDLVSELLSEVTSSDGDGDIAGIAVASLSGSGTWFFSTDSGSNWSQLSPTEGNVILLASDARLYFQPDSDTSGEDIGSVVFHAWDGTEGTSGESLAATTGGSSSLSEGTVSASIDVIANPLATVQSLTEGEDSTLSVAAVDEAIIGSASTITVQFSDINNGVIVNTASPDESISEATLQQLIDGEIAFSHDGSEVAPSFVMTLVGSSLSFQAVAANVTFIAVNDVPVANDDSYGTDEDVNLVVDADSGLLANDTDVEGDALTAALVSQASNGVASINADGSFEYQPNDDFFGTDSFVYSTTDANGDSSNATVFITVNSVNDVPSPADDSITISEDGSATTVDVLANDTDVDTGDSLTIVSVDDTSTVGTVSLVEGVITYSPNGEFEALGADETGVDTFTYTVEDESGAQSTATVTVVVQGVNDAPVVVDDSFIVSEDLIQGVLNILQDEFDPEGDDTTIAIDNSATMGILELVDGSLLYTPGDDFQSLTLGDFGQDSFTYTVTDSNGAESTATVSLVIQGQNDGPTANNVVVDNLTEETISVDVSVLDNDSDVDGDTFTIVSIDTTSLIGTATFTDDSVSFVLPELESLAFGDVFVTTLSYTIEDEHGAQDTAEVRFEVAGRNDAPEASDDEITIIEDDADTTISVLLNDSDIDTGDIFSMVSLNTDGLLGTATISGSDIIYSREGSFEDLAQGDSVQEIFTYTIEDANGLQSTATVTVNITGENDAPTAADDGVTVSEDDGITAIDVLANDSDVDTGATLTVVSINTDSTEGLVTLIDGQISYNPNAQFEGLAEGQTTTDTFTYTVEDEHGAQTTATVTVTVEGKNDAPVAANDTASMFENDSPLLLDVTANDVDVDSGDTQTIVALDDKALIYGAVSLTADNQISYTPNGSQEALAEGEQVTEVFNYTIEDAAGEQSTATVTITITGQNDTPLAEDDALDISEDAADTAIDLLANDTDPDSTDNVTIVSVDASGATGLVSFIDGQISYDPNGQFEGLALGDSTTDTFQYTIEDSQGAQSTATVTLTIKGENDAPIAVDDSQSMFEDDGATLIDVLANDTDADTGDTHTIKSVDGAGLLYGFISITSDNQILYIPNGSQEALAAGQQVLETFTYTIEDSLGEQSTATVSLTITGQNDAPATTDVTGLTVDEDSSLVVSSVDDGLLAQAHDTDFGDILTASLSSQATNGIAVVNSDGTYTYTPNADFNGTDSFQYLVTDSSGETATATVTITVNPIADAPVIDNTGTLSQILAFSATSIVDMAEPIGYNVSEFGNFAALLGNDGSSDVLQLFSVDEFGEFQFAHSVSLTTDLVASNAMIVDFGHNEQFGNFVQVINAADSSIEIFVIDESSGVPLLVSAGSPSTEFLSSLSNPISSDSTFTQWDLYASDQFARQIDLADGYQQIAVSNGSEVRVGSLTEYGLFFDFVINNTTNTEFTGSDSIALVDQAQALYVTKDDSADIDIYVNVGSYEYATTLVAGVDIPAMGPEQLLLSSPTTHQFFILEQSAVLGEPATLHVFDFEVGASGPTANALVHVESIAVVDATDPDNLINIEQVSQFNLQDDGALAIVSEEGHVVQLNVHRDFLPQISEDSPAPTSSADGTSVSQFLVANDADGDEIGIAVGSASGDGIWHYSTDDGTTWQVMDAGQFDSGNVLLLDKDTLIYYQPGQDEHGYNVARMNYVAWDGSEGSVGDYFNPTSFGEGTAFSNTADVLYAAIDAVNDAPEVVYQSDFTADANIAVYLSSALAVQDIDNFDADLVYTLAVAPTLGELQLYEDLDGDNVYEPRTLTVGDTFTQQEVNEGLVKFIHFETVDGSTNFELSVTDGIETVSGIALNVSVQAALSDNNSPYISPYQISYEQNDSAGTALDGAGIGVGEILVEASADDFDQDPLGIAIISVDNAGDGKWQYSIDGGMTFTDLPSLMADEAFYLNAGAILYYATSGDATGAPTINFHAWDQTDGVANATVQLFDETGGNSALSFDTATLQASLVVDAAPVLHVVRSFSTDDSSPVQLFQSTQFRALIFDQELASADDYSGATVDIGAFNGIVEFNTDAAASTTFDLALDGNEVKQEGATIATLFNGEGNTILSFVTTDGQSANQAEANEILSWLQYDIDDNTTGSLSVGFVVDDGTDASGSTFGNIHIDLDVNEAPFVSAANVPYEQSAGAVLARPGAGKSVESIVYYTGAYDANGDPMGIAISSVDSGEDGTWYYSIDGSAPSIVIPTIESGEAFYLPPEGRLYYQPGSAETSATSASLLFHMWDQTDGLTAGQSHMVTETGGRSALSDSTAFLSVGIELDSSPSLSVVDALDVVPGDTVDLFQGFQSQALFFDQELASDNTDGYTGASITMSGHIGVVGFDTGASSVSGLSLSGNDVLENGETIASLVTDESGSTLTFLSSNGEYADQAQVDEVLSWLQFTMDEFTDFDNVNLTVSDGSDDSDDTFGNISFLNPEYGGSV